MRDLSCTLNYYTWLSELQCRVRAWCYHNQQSAPTIHQSFIWNNSTADSWNKTSPPLQADDSQPDKGSDLGLNPAVLPHSMKHRQAGSPVSGLTFCVYECRCVCIVSTQRISWWNLTACLYGGAKRSFDVLQEAATHSENVLSIVTVYKPVWRITQGRKVSGMNYGYHMSGAGTDSWARALFEDWNTLINVAGQKKSKLFNRYSK